MLRPINSDAALERWAKEVIQLHRTGMDLPLTTLKSLGYWCIRFRLLDEMPAALIAELAMLGFLKSYDY
jgi:hypothetical protein